MFIVVSNGVLAQNLTLPNVEPINEALSGDVVDEASDFEAEAETSDLEALPPATNDDTPAESEPLAAVAPPEPVNKLAVSPIIRQALNHNPEVRARLAAFYAAIQDLRGSEGARLPSVDLNANAGVEWLSYDDRTAYDIFSGDVVVTQSLYQGNRTVNEMARLNHQGVVRFFELEEAVNLAVYETIVAYEDVQRTRRLLALARENHELTRRVRAQVESRVQSGAAPRVQLEQMNGRMALAESNLLVESANLHDAMARFRRYVGASPDDELTPNEFDAAWIPEDIQDVLSTVYTYNPRFRAAVATEAVAGSAVEVQRSAFAPEVFLRARQSIGRNQGGFDSRINELGGRTGVEVVLNYSLYRGGANEAALQATLDRQDASRERRENVCLDLRFQTQVRYNDQQRLQEQLASLRLHQASADYVRRAYRDQFDIGQRSLVEVLDIETEYLDASRALVNGEHDLNIANALTLRTMGQLLSTLEINHPAMPTLQDFGLQAPIIDGASACGPIEPEPEPVEATPVIEFELPEFLMEAPTPAAPPTPPPLVFTSTTSFDVGSTELSADGREFLETLAQHLSTMSNVEAILVAGHTDNTGPDRINRQLSQARADAARDYLINLGVPAESIEAIGFGSEMPVATNDTPAGRTANRRIEVEVRARD
ncbi:TolC family protein [Salinispirillum marinum]|uniref:TolC family protein n=2 Tax=Saccharospirillaceae TaxID=255527 RepID=A0ABV8BJN2_9GAMM